MSLKIQERENGYSVTETNYQKPQKTWVFRDLKELSAFLVGYYEKEVSDERI